MHQDSTSPTLQVVTRLSHVLGARRWARSAELLSTFPGLRFLCYPPSPAQASGRASHHSSGSAVRRHETTTIINASDESFSTPTRPSGEKPPPHHSKFRLAPRPSISHNTTRAQTTRAVSITPTQLLAQPARDPLDNMSNFRFSAGGKDNVNKIDLGRPSTPIRNNFVEPVSTPMGSPSKRTLPPGANDLPQAMESHLKLNSNVFDTPIKLGRPQSVIHALSPGKANIYPPDLDFTTSSLVDERPSSPLKHQGQENTPPTASKHGHSQSVQHNHAALSRQDIYQSTRPAPPAKKFDTSRGLTQEERELLKKPNVRRLVNVTQLCKLFDGPTPHHNTSHNGY